MRKFQSQSVGKQFFLVTGLFILLFLVYSCESYVTPNKVERILPKDTWRITTFSFGGVSLSDSLDNVTLGFGESGSITAFPTSSGETGSWSVSSGKKPTILYISGFFAEPYFFLNDDWEVTECSKDRMRLISDNGATSNSMTLVKVN